VNTPLRTTVIDDLEQFRLLGKEWDDLRRSARGATPFQSWAWMYSWWESYGADYELRIITVRNDVDLLLGLVPLMLERWLGQGRLLFLGTRRNDYQDILVREGCEDEVAVAVRRAFRRLDGWQVADLHQLRPASFAWSFVQQWDGPRTWIRNEGSPVVEVKPWEELVTSLSRNQRSTVRRALRRAEEDGVHVELVRPDDARHAARRLVALHQELWRDRDMTSEHSTPRWASFIEAAARRTLAQGLGEISEFRRNGEVVMSLFWLVGPDFVGFYHSGVSQEALRRYQWNALLLREGIEIARGRGARRFDLLRGEEDYKLQWASEIIPSRRVVLGRNPIAWVPYVAYVSSRSQLERYLSSPKCPSWIKQTLRGVKRAVTYAVKWRGQLDSSEASGSGDRGRHGS
jgi:CelD/BcsL family acetyltransferase involved in cellulose biosynthesis